MWPKESYYFGCLTYNDVYVCKARYKCATTQAKKEASPASIFDVGGPAWPERGRHWLLERFL